MIVIGSRAEPRGDGLQDGVQVGPIVNMQQLRRVHRYTQVAREERATVLTGGEVLTEGHLAEGWFYPPTIFTDVQPDMRVAREEIFGPVLSVIRVPDSDAAFEAANAVEYGLAASLYTRDVRSIFQFVDRVDVGIAHVNQPTLGGEVHLPFGGVKASGIGPPK